MPGKKENEEVTAEEYRQKADAAAQRFLTLSGTLDEANVIRVSVRCMEWASALAAPAGEPADGLTYFYQEFVREATSAKRPEQLAEQLGVSRQAISKWESGKAVPETDTLISISKYFDVSLDYLMKEENSISENAVSLEVHQTEATNKREKRILGIATCIIGVVLLIAWGIVSVFMPSASEQIGTSSMITIDGNGIFLLICLVAIIAGAVLLLKSTSNK